MLPFALAFGRIVLSSKCVTNHDIKNMSDSRHVPEYMKRRVLLPQQGNTTFPLEFGTAYKTVRRYYTSPIPGIWYTKKTRGNCVFYIIDFDVLMSGGDQVLVPLEPGKRLFVGLPIAEGSTEHETLTDYVNSALPPAHVHALKAYAAFVSEPLNNATPAGLADERDTSLAQETDAFLEATKRSDEGLLSPEQQKELANLPASVVLGKVTQSDLHRQGDVRSLAVDIFDRLGYDWLVPSSA